jgi:pimeloyl-ACP methyl ester carboxylesterase
MRSRYFRSLGPHGFHRLHYLEWGDPANARVAVCVHGLTRNARDFDVLAERLSETHRVLCVDVPGRGQSEWLTHPMDYGYPLYCQDLAALIVRADVDSVDWVGTSMGGLIGMMLAAQQGSPIRRMVLNDVGPFIAVSALSRIRDYLAAVPAFPDFASLEAYLRQVHAPFGLLNNRQWQTLAANSTRRDPNGSWRLHYDPGIAQAFQAAPLEDVKLWLLWDALRSPTLVLRGADSDVLSADTAREMSHRGPRAEVVEYHGVGHAPALLEESQIRPVLNWLRTP